MSQNLIDVQMSPEALTTIETALTMLEAHLVPLRTGLDAGRRRGLTRMGDKSEAFCRQAVVAFVRNADLLPRSFDLIAYQRDLAALDALRPHFQRFLQLHELMNDIETALGSDLMTASLEGYAFLKVSGRSTGLDSLREMLSARFNRRRRREPAVEEPGTA